MRSTFFDLIDYFADQAGRFNRVRGATGCDQLKAGIEKFCGNAQVVMLLKKPNADSVFSSKEIGFDSIVFADASVNKMYVTLERAYLHHHRI